MYKKYTNYRSWSKSNCYQTFAMLATKRKLRNICVCLNRSGNCYRSGSNTDEGSNMTVYVCQKNANSIDLIWLEPVAVFYGDVSLTPPAKRIVVPKNDARTWQAFCDKTSFVSHQEVLLEIREAGEELMKCLTLSCRLSANIRIRKALEKMWYAALGVCLTSFIALNCTGCRCQNSWRGKVNS